MSKLSKALIAAAGNSGGAGLTVEDVFSTYLYTGNGSTQSIDNGIDLAGEGGLVWVKNRDTSGWEHVLYDTERGATNDLRTNSTAAAFTPTPQELTSFNADGFSVATNGSQQYLNFNSKTYASWTFRKAEKFFDVVTYGYQGNGVGTSAQIPHNLGSAPAFIMIKAVDKAENFICWHRDLNGYLKMGTQGTDSLFTGTGAFGSLTPSMTDTHFTVGYDGGTNFPGYNYVAYLFAHDAGGFGDDGSENIIKCGSYTGNGGTQEINLGFEPQWLLVKSSTQTDSWFLTDIMRGMPNNGPTPYLLPNMSNAEAVASAGFFPQATATGFKIGASGSVNASGQTFIYIAIRRPMKTPESGTEVFAIDTGTGADDNPKYISNFPVDMAIITSIDAVESNYNSARLTGAAFLKTESTDPISATIPNFSLDFNNGWFQAGGTNRVTWMFKRATGFFDVVAYTGDGTAGRTVSHNLGVAPEFMVIKQRDEAGRNWIGTYLDGGTEKEIFLNTSNGAGTGGQVTNITNNSFQLTTNFNTNKAASTYIAYLFATLAGVSKVGSYTGTGADLNVDCGFSAGARFILIKRTDSTGDWYVWDSVRGIVAGNDPYLLLNSTAAEVTSTDYIDPLSSGFTVTSSAPAALNASGGTYLFLAIA